MVVNLPMLLNFFYKGISPFLDPVTRDKVSVPRSLNRCPTLILFRCGLTPISSTS